MKTGKIENIIFDLGNTLCFYDFYYFYEGISRLEKKLNPAEFRRYIINKKLDIKLITGRLAHKDLFKKLKKKFNLKTGYSDFIFLYKDIFWENTPMKNFLEQVSNEKKYKLFLLSNTCSHHINYICKNFPYVNLIRNRILSFKVKMKKPDKRIFRFVIQKYKLNPEKTLLIDDLMENVKSARSLGIKGIHYSKHKSFLRQLNILIN
ncbi:MAG TPA: HAD-IA family hydrolase [Ignavibacteria bacterium]